MRRLAAFAASLVLAGCGSTGTSDYSQLYHALRQGGVAGFGSGRVTREQAAAIPYASMGYRVNDDTEQLIVLATDSNGEQLWTSAAHIVIATRGGRIVRTAGLPNNISSVTPIAGQDIPPPAAAIKGTVTYTRLEDLPDAKIYGAALICRATYRGRETIVILGNGIETAKVDEACHSDTLKWSFTDNYWLDPESGLAWRSAQHISPKNGKIETEILRPPG